MSKRLFRIDIMLHDDRGNGIGEGSGDVADLTKKQMINILLNYIDFVRNDPQAIEFDSEEYACELAE